jgi:Spc7 kinetochore protein
MRVLLKKIRYDSIVSLFRIEHHADKVADCQPPISISDFFQMTDIRFMDEITAPRRSTHPSSRPSAREPSLIPLAEYVVAVDVDTPQLQLYQKICRRGLRRASRIIGKRKMRLRR